jgi:hypothetical protein
MQLKFFILLLQGWARSKNTQDSCYVSDSLNAFCYTSYIETPLSKAWPNSGICFSFYRCKIYYANSSTNATEPCQLPRRELIKVFDCAEFQHRLQEVKTKGGKVPSVSVLLSLGENWSLTKPISKMRISATVTNAKCWYDLRNVSTCQERYHLSS